MIIGKTLLGALELKSNIGIEGYELSTYIGAIIVGVTTMILGIKFGSKTYNKNQPLI